MAFPQSLLDAGGVPIGSVYVPGVGWAALQGTSNTNTDGSSNPSTALAIGRAATVVALGASAARTTSGNSGDLAVGMYTELAIDANLSAVSGTSPTIQFFVDRKGADGSYYPIWQQSSASTAIGQVSTSIGAGCSSNQAFGSTIRLRWTIGGTSPSWTFSYSIIGK